eukprot:TRINITY_DN23166_c0_g1_i1.p2 TRINITY_DN23166_c0_g1~~TRINITY_DN23166_c0_g1_i1.p2  ORF type:complete len:568 (+),score=310.35 TRINITY_DN23166_c0_g1_i1:278-1981(+)
MVVDTKPAAADVTGMDNMSDKEVLQKFDLTRIHARYLDKHMFFYPLMRLRQVNHDSEEENKAYSDDALFDSEMQLLLKTRMTDHTIEQYMAHKNLDNEQQVPDDILQQKEKINKETKLQTEKTKRMCQKFLDVFCPEDQLEEGFAVFSSLIPDVADGQVDKSKSSFNLEYLNQQYGIRKEDFEGLLQYAKLQYEEGKYLEAQMFLHYYMTIGDLDNDNEARWGKLAADTLVNDWPAAMDTIKLIQDSIDKGVPQQYATPGAQLQARAWLMHWSLFAFFYYSNEEGHKYDEGLDKLVYLWLPDMYSQEKEGASNHRYLRVLQTICPHLIRYLAVAVIVGQEKTGKRAAQESGHIKMKQRNKDLNRLIEAEKAYYSDPITNFVKKLLSECDLEGAHAVLPQCELIMEADFFLQPHKDRFMRQAREMIFENYCRIHSVMDIGMVARKLGQDTEEAECYIVKMIRGAQLDAKIDSEANQVLLASQGSTFYRNIREKTKLVRDKTDQLMERLQDRRPHEDTKEESKDQPKGEEEAAQQRPAAAQSQAPPREQQQREQRPAGPRSSMRDFTRD